jgi:predicted ferric reductase
VTAVAQRPAPAPLKVRRSTRKREVWRDALTASAWLAGAGSIAFVLASGTASVGSFAELSTTVGRITGMVASMLIMIQLLLASRAPFVERVLGHDNALATHGLLGRVGFFVILAHAITITIGYAAVGRTGFLDEVLALTLHYGGPMTAAVGGFALLCAVIVTSLVAVRSRWRYENWHAVHLLSYAAIVLTIPHQFLNGSTVSTSSFAWWYWAVLWTVSVGSLLVYRVAAPIWLSLRHSLRVADVSRLPDGSAVIAMKGRALGSLDPAPGQFLLFRFLAKDLWDEAHPYSLSRARNGNWIRITVKPLGDHSAAVANVPIGTKVAIEGPLGIFHDRTRTGERLVLAGAGVGITPILSLLEGATFHPGQCTVIVRARSRDDAPHLDELLRIAESRGATVHVLLGPRGFGWAPRGEAVRLRELVGPLDDADVFACGPEPWVEALRTDAMASGLPGGAFHAEQFAW